LNIAETYLLLNAVTQGAFRTNPWEFLVSPQGLSKVGADGTWVVSLPELLAKGTSGGAYRGVASNEVMDVIKANLGLDSKLAGNRSGEWMKVAGQMIFIPLAFRLGKKIARPVLTRTRKMLKDAGLKGTVTI
jgi:hypothetical protein